MAVAQSERENLISNMEDSEASSDMDTIQASNLSSLTLPSVTDGADAMAGDTVARVAVGNNASAGAGPDAGASAAAQSSSADVSAHGHSATASASDDITTDGAASPQTAFTNPSLAQDDTLLDPLQSDSDSDTDSLDDTGCCSKQRSCYRCSVIDFLSIGIRFMLFVVSIAGAVYCLWSKIICQDQCLLDATYSYDGSVHYSSSKKHCETVLYATLVSAGLPVLFTCVAWVAQFSENKKWLMLQNLINCGAVAGIIAVTTLQFSMFTDWCHGLETNMAKSDPHQISVHKNLTCKAAIKIWDDENETNKLEHLRTLTLTIMYLLIGCVIAWVLSFLVDFAKWCIVSKRLKRHLEADRNRATSSDTDSDSDSGDDLQSTRTRSTARRRHRRSIIRNRNLAQLS